mmetsp:Transcript_7078/g.19809  ORF Transcript_7078/g.19809 Transcript_7078/m.19809 type:complete len:700 (+) Transcript_7078:24-2123(+)
MVIQGVIRPPPEIRAVANRTALYVAKNGRAFEIRILNSEKGKTPKFAFLQPNNPFHAYYEDRITFYENGGTDDKDDTKKDKTDDKKDAAQESKEKNQKDDDDAKKKGNVIVSAPDPVGKALLMQRNNIAKIRSKLDPSKDSESNAAEETKEETNTPGRVAVPPPPPLHFINLVPPSSLAVAQIETIQLVAQMTALDGKGGGFLQALTIREWNNPQFAFCQPRHGHFAYFSALVDAYQRVLKLWADNKSGLTSDNADDLVPQLANNVDTCLEVAAYRSEYERDQAEHRAENQGVASTAQIDWQDFVVVETIDFAVDEKVVTLPPPPPTTANPNQNNAKTAVSIQKESDDMDDSDDDDGKDEPIRVVPSYTPRVVSAAQQPASSEMLIDPITGKSVPVSQMPEHMRIQLLDPKWAEERKKFQEKQKESNLVTGDVVASNLERFAQARGMSKEDAALSAAAQRKKKRTLEEVLREQALQPSTQVGPSLPGVASALPPPSLRTDIGSIPPPPPPPPGFEGRTTAPDTKKPRTDGAIVPPPLTTVAPKPAPPTNTDPFAAAMENTAAALNENDGATVPSTGLGSTVEASTSQPGELLSEAAFAQTQTRPEAITIQIRIPNDPAQMAWNFYGQIVSTTVNVMDKVKAVKQEISRQHMNNMPANKIQLKSQDRGGFFLKDSQTLAAHNIGSGSTLELRTKTRGGRK